MAKIGTAHIEIKPVLNEEALDTLVQRIEDAIEAGVSRALHKSNQGLPTRVWQDGKVVGYIGKD